MTNSNDEMPGVYVWKAPVLGWMYKVVFVFAATTPRWALTQNGAWKRAVKIAIEEA